MAIGFFDNPEPSSGAQAQFLIVLRDLAALWKTDVRPENTTVESFNQTGRTFVGVDVPGSPDTTMWVLARLDEDAPRGLDGGWGNPSYPGDFWTKNYPHDLEVRGLAGSPVFFATLTAIWFEEQLMRALFRDEASQKWASPWATEPRPVGRGRSRVPADRGPLIRSGGFAV